MAQSPTKARTALLMTLLGVGLAPSTTASAYDCPDELGECLTVWQAHALGALEVESAGSGATVNWTNVGTKNICLDEQVLYSSDLTQAIYLGAAATDVPIELTPGETWSAYYGSFTTDNGVQSPYLGQYAWWCLEFGQYVTGGATFDYLGEGVPTWLEYYGDNVTDTDGDGIDDDVDWAGFGGVQTNYNIWDYQATHAVMSVGKTAAESGTSVLVTLIIRNFGSLDGEGTISDTVPSGYTASGFSTTPDSSVTNSDGSTTWSWTVPVVGMTAYTVVTGETITYTLTPDVASDVPYLELEESVVEYDDGLGSIESGYSMPAMVLGLDGDGDGVVDCSTTEVCDGRDNNGDGQIDEGFDVDGDGYTTCGTEPACEVLFDLSHGEDTYSDPTAYSTTGWGPAADLLIDAGYLWTSNKTEVLTEALLADYQAVVVAEPLSDFSADEVDALLAYVDAGGGLFLVTDFNETYLDQVANEFGVDYVGLANNIGWVPVEDWDTSHPVSDGITSTWWPYASTFQVLYASVQVLATYDSEPVYAVLEYGAGRVVFGSDNEAFARYGLEQLNDPDAGTVARDNETLWLQTMGWLADCEEPTPPDCDDEDATSFPGAEEFCDGVDNDCDDEIDEGFDADGDGWAECFDCDDSDASVNPDVEEVCDGIDNNCDGYIDEGFDSDSDGVADCFDVEECDGVDNDGDGLIDEGFDADGDGYASCDGDCDDADAAINPGAEEVCDGADNNCDGSVDEGFDSDSDGIADCFDVEECDGVDNDGDGLIDEGFDLDGDGYSSCDGDCDDTDASVNPDAEEVCDGIDNDCDGTVDESEDADGDGFSLCDGDCDDTDASVNPGATEVCDEVDNDCDGVIDEGDVCGTEEVCDGVDNDGDGEIDEDFDADGDGYTTCGFEPDCNVMFELAHGEGTWSDPTSYASSGWGDAADMLVANGYTWASNESDVLTLALLQNYSSVVIAEPLADFDTSEVDALVEYVAGGGGLVLLVDFEDSYMDPIANEFGVDFDGTAGDIGWVAIDDWDTTHPVSDGISSVYWPWGSTLQALDASVQVLGSYDGQATYAVAEYGEGHVVFSADNELFATYGFDQIGDPDPSAVRDNDILWLQTMKWASDCEPIPADCDDTDASLNWNDADGDGYSTCDGDCDDEDATVVEVCCDETVDADADGWNECDDCDDSDSTLNLDDADGDGTTTCDDDCDDEDASLNLDDADDDGYTSCDDDCDDSDASLTPEDADGDDYSTCDDDCDDDDPAVYPSAEEVCDEIDNDCDLQIDEGFDTDEDGYTDCGGDCNDGDWTISPDAEEICGNGIDENCDGIDVDCSGEGSSKYTGGACGCSTTENPSGGLLAFGLALGLAGLLRRRED